MYYELNKYELNKLEEISSITCTDYELKGNFIPVQSLMAALEDLLVSYNYLDEVIDDMRQEISENYELKNVDEYEEYGVSERDFL